MIFPLKFANPIETIWVFAIRCDLLSMQVLGLSVAVSLEVVVSYASGCDFSAELFNVILTSEDLLQTVQL